MANTSRDESPDSLFVPAEPYDNEHFAQPPRRLPSGLALPRSQSRFAGDGWDFRSPVMSSNSDGTAGAVNESSRATDVIDLTEDDHIPVTGPSDGIEREPPFAGSARAQRLPRFDRNIIDVESDAVEEDAHARSNTRPNNHNPNLHPRYSVLRRPNRIRAHPTSMEDRSAVDDNPTPQSHSNRLTHRSITPFSGAISEPIDLTADDNDDIVDDVVLMRVEPRSAGVNNDRPGITAGMGTRALATVADMIGRTGGNRLRARFDDIFAHDILAQAGLRGVYEEFANRHYGNAGTDNNQNRDDGMPRANIPRVVMNPQAIAIDLNYDTPAFAMGFAGANEAAQPKYEPPPAAASGFTRSPGEDEAVVCPNCGDELALGSSDQKQEVWVIKKCGHAYCGDCARYRTKAIRGSKKGKGKATEPLCIPSFKQCVVDGCKEAATSRSFMHIFLGS